MINIEASAQEKRLGRLSDGTEVLFVKQGSWDVELRQNGTVVWEQPQPIQVRQLALAQPDNQSVVDDGYRTLTINGSTW